MKRFLLILSLFLVTGVRLFAQDEDDSEVSEKIQDKMNEYIQKQLKVSKEEAAKFTPVFLKYFKDWTQTLRDNRGDRLVLQQKLADLRLRYRPEFRNILGERRGDRVYEFQRKFIVELRTLRQERIRNNPRSGQRL